MGDRVRFQFVPALFAAVLAVPLLAENWPQWRGPSLNGISGEKNLPVHWSATENIVWKLAMPDRSGATPIIWGDSIFLNVAEGPELSLWCVDKGTGAIKWKRPLGGGNYKINKQNMSSPSPVTDGKRVVALTGTGMLRAFDFSGKELWVRDIQKEYGKFGFNWGYGSSPLLYRNDLYVQVLHGMKTSQPPYLLRINKKTGKTIWRVERATDAVRESRDSYRTPMLLHYGGRTEIVLADGNCATGHDAASGRELWRVRGLNPENSTAFRTIASPVAANGIIYVPTRVRPMLVFRAGGSGDVTATHMLWTLNTGPDVPTPVTDGTYFYIAGDKGIVSCLDPATGKEIWGRQRIKTGTYSASPVLADGKLYVTSEDGVTTVLRAGNRFEVLAENDLDGFTLSTPAISGGRIFLRTSRALYCVGKPKQ